MYFRTFIIPPELESIFSDDLIDEIACFKVTKNVIFGLTSNIMPARTGK